MSTLPQGPTPVRPVPNRVATPPAAPPTRSKALPRFRRAVKRAARLRMALVGASKTGKTYTALKIAKALVPQGRTALIDTEHGTASKYAGSASTPDAFEFDVIELDVHHPYAYIDAIRAAEADDYDVLILDSFSHEWMGRDGCLELVDRLVQGGSNSFMAWSEVTPIHRELIEVILSSPCHIIVTMRAKTEWVVDKDDRGKIIPRKVGLAPIQREGIEYEFDVAGDLDQNNTLRITSSRCSALQNRSFRRAGVEVATILSDWLADGESTAPSATPADVAKSTSPQVAIATSPQVAKASSPQVANPPPPPALPEGLSEVERNVAAEITHALPAATTLEEVKTLRKHALAELPTRADGTTRASLAYRNWHNAAFGEAFARVGAGGGR